ncbi:hypothetical protein DVH24_023215 [Malus domestica]|uniref:Uncharacterized protein n=1 Tax=Malus domestica TaxID=3750 RepID=A0A498KPR0_MALDO|nr:hypothetical protein DVH24_023215 [Malus domestica]
MSEYNICKFTKQKTRYSSNLIEIGLWTEPAEQVNTLMLFDWKFGSQLFVASSEVTLKVDQAKHGAMIHPLTSVKKIVLRILRFKVSLIIEDVSDETSAIITGKLAKRLFGTSCYDLLPYAILQCQGQIKKFQLQFGNLKNDFNRNDLLIQAIFNNKIQDVQSSSKASYVSMAEFEEEIKTSLPPFHPRLSQHRLQKVQFGRVFLALRLEKNKKRETEITEEIDEQKASDTEDFPIKSLRNKVYPNNLK